MKLTRFITLPSLSGLRKCEVLMLTATFLFLASENYEISGRFVAVFIRGDCIHPALYSLPNLHKSDVLHGNVEACVT